MLHVHMLRHAQVHPGEELAVTLCNIDVPFNITFTLACAIDPTITTYHDGTGAPVDVIFDGTINTQVRPGQTEIAHHSVGRADWADAQGSCTAPKFGNVCPSSGRWSTSYAALPHAETTLVLPRLRLHVSLSRAHAGLDPAPVEPGTARAARRGVHGPPVQAELRDVPLRRPVSW